VGPILRLQSPARHRAPERLLGSLALWLAACFAVLPASGEPEPFEVLRHRIPGRVYQVWPLAVGPCEPGEHGLLVLSAEGGPPEQRKVVTWMPCGSAMQPGTKAIVQRSMASDVVLVDVAEVPGRSGTQLLGISASGIRIEPLTGSTVDQPVVEWPVPGGLPLPPRPRNLSRVEVVADWHANGRPTALVPALDGARLVDLENGQTRSLPLPVFADYRTWEPFIPATVQKWMLQEVTWPSLARGDDNGDGRPDLFALSRWAIWIYHSGPEGLPDQPTRHIELLPFDEEDERRHEATAISYFARDLDGDGRSDLVLNTVSGGLLDGRSVTRVYLNPGGGVDLAVRPAVVRETRDGFSGVDFVDMNGDGREELVEATLDFGILQIVRMLLTRSIEARVSVLALDSESEDGTRTLFEDDLSVRLDFEQSSMKGLVPSLGDWNGDGLRDFFLPEGEDRIALRLGSGRPDTPLFGRIAGTQSAGLTRGESRAADLDGDGLDEIVAFDPTDADAPLVVMRNRGRMPGTAPSLRAVD